MKFSMGKGYWELIIGDEKKPFLPKPHMPTNLNQ
jgi:hypothetical protein